MTADFSGQSVVVTGSGRGIGEGIAEAFVAGGVNVLLVTRTVAELEATRDELRLISGHTEMLASEQERLITH